MPPAQAQVWTEVPRSALSGIDWPAIPSAADIRMLALLQQLERSQWWAPQRIEHHQFLQLSRLLEHAHRTNPFYRERLVGAGYRTGQVVTPELWRRIPVLDRGVAPALRATTRFFASLRWIQRGTVQAYVAYILFALVLLLVWR